MFKRFMFLAVAATMMCFSAQAQKFGYINTSEIFNVMPEKATAENTLKTASDKYEAEFKNLQDAFQKKMTDYEAADKDATTPQAIKDRHNQELQDDYVKIQNFQLVPRAVTPSSLTRQLVPSSTPVPMPRT